LTLTRLLIRLIIEIIDGIKQRVLISKQNIAHDILAAALCGKWTHEGEVPLQDVS